MTYAGERLIYDADSHLMELPDFLRDYADPDMRDRLPSISFAAGGKLQTALEELGARGAHSPARVSVRRSASRGFASASRRVSGLPVSG